VARRLAENADVSVLLLEAGGDDDVPEVMRAEQWPLNLGSERDWNFSAQPNPHLNGRAIPFGMGKVLGGGSSINVMARASPPPVNGDPISPSLIGTISTSRQELPLRPDERQRIPPRRPRPSW